VLSLKPAQKKIANKLIWASLNAEKQWERPNSARLPSLNYEANKFQIPLFDEIFLPSREGEILLTLVPQNASVNDYHHTLGLAFERCSVFDSLPDWLDAGSPDWTELLLAMPEKLNQIFSRYSDISHVPYAFIPAIYQSQLKNHEYPDLEAVLFANSKSVCTELCLNAGIRCDGVVITTPKDLSDCLDTHDMPLVIKEAFGVSGKGSLVIRDQRIRERVKRYLLDQVNNGCSLDLVIEPWLSKERDFSSQWRIDKSGCIQRIGVSYISNSGMKFSSVSPVSTEFMNVLEEQHYFDDMNTILGQLVERGYFGPVCIDSMLLDDGTIYPVVEINARESMGSIAQRWFEVVESSSKTKFTQFDIAYHTPLDVQAVLESLRHEAALYNGKEGGLPIAANSLQLPVENGKMIGRWFQLTVGLDDEQVLHFHDCLKLALHEQGATLL
jgi:hypothetical protein